jgi:cytochrome b involved in lipid metabolism
MPKYYTNEEVAFHNAQDDCWVSIFDKVYDITKLISENRGILATPLIEAAGQSISHWFSEKTGDVRVYMDPERNIYMPYTPNGRFIHVPPPDPRDNTPAIDTPWWKDKQYIIGSVSNIHIIINYSILIYPLYYYFV